MNSSSMLLVIFVCLVVTIHATSTESTVTSKTHTTSRGPTTSSKVTTTAHTTKTTTAKATTTTHTTKTTTAKATTTTHKADTTTANGTTTTHKADTTTVNGTTAIHSNLTTTSEYSNSSTTSEEMTTTMPHKPSTSSKPSTSTPTFRLKQGKVTCLLLQANVKTSVTVTSLLQGKHVLHSKIPADATIKGKCSSSTNLISLIWKADAFTILTLNLTFSKDGGDYSLTDAGFGYLIQSLTSFDATKWSRSVDGLITTDVGTTFNCTPGIDLKVGLANMTMTNLRVAAFMDDSSSSPQFLKAGSYCSSGLSGGAIAGIVIGVIVGVLVLFTLVCVGLRYKRRMMKAPYRTLVNS